MAVVEVACPNCKAMLKAPDNMAGKKARCKKCNASFRIPGQADAGDSAADLQMLSTVDAPVSAPAASAFDFEAMHDTPPEPKKPVPKPAPPPKPDPRPVAKKPAEPVADNPFSFGDEPIDSPKAPPPQPKSTPSTAKAQSTPKARALPPEPKPAAKRATAPVQSAAEAGGFDFGAILDGANDQPPSTKSKSTPKAPGLAEQSFKMPDEEDVPDAETVPEAEAVPDEEPMNLDDNAPAASADPFGFPGDAEASGGPKSTRSKSKPRSKHDDDDDERPQRGGYHKAEGGGSGKTKLIIAAVGVLLLGGAITGVVLIMNKAKNNDQVKATDKDKKPEVSVDPTPEPPKVDPKGKETQPKKDSKGKEITPKGDPGAKATNPGTATTEPPPRPTMLAIDASVKTIQPQAARAKQEQFQESIGTPAVMEIEFDKIVRFFPPSKSENDFGVLWEKEKAFAPNTPGNKLVMDVCNPFGTKQYRIEFTGDGKAIPACDLSEDSKWFAHVDGGKLTVWSIMDQKKLVDAVDLHKLAPEFGRGGVVAVYFPRSAFDAKDAPPKRVVTVSAIGAVHLWDLTTRQLVGSAFIPGQGRANRVSDIKAVTLGSDRNSLVIAVGGVIYSVTISEDRVLGNEYVDLKGDVPTSLAISIIGNGPVLYVFETGGDKKERVVRLITSQGGGKSWRWPDSAGKPVAAGWINAEKAVVSTDRGALLIFEMKDTNFFPEVLALPANDKCRHATNDVNHWYLIPHPRDAKKSVLLQFPPPGLADEPAMLIKGSIPTGRIDEKGIWK